MTDSVLAALGERSDNYMLKKDIIFNQDNIANYITDKYNYLTYMPSNFFILNDKEATNTLDRTQFRLNVPIFFSPSGLFSVGKDYLWRQTTSGTPGAYCFSKFYDNTAIFRGSLLAAINNKAKANLRATIYIAMKKMTGINYVEAPEIKTESIKFNNNFQCCTYDTEGFFYLMTPQMLDFMNGLFKILGNFYLYVEPRTGFTMLALQEAGFFQGLRHYKKNWNRIFEKVDRDIHYIEVLTDFLASFEEFNLEELK